MEEQENNENYPELKIGMLLKGKEDRLFKNMFALIVSKNGEQYTLKPIALTKECEFMSKETICNYLKIEHVFNYWDVIARIE